MDNFINEESIPEMPEGGKLNQYGGRKKTRRKRRKKKRGGDIQTSKKRRGNILTNRNRGVSVDIEAAHHLVEEISFENYIKDIDIVDYQGNPVNLHDIFKHRINGNPNHFLHYDTREKIHELVKKIHSKGWVNCDSECKSLLQPFVKQEINSTLFILRVLTKSLVQPRGSNLKLKFKLRVDKPLTGDWNNDSNNIVLIVPEQVNPRLIMGLGPSASGKTFWVENLITLLSNSPTLSSTGFPKAFLSIDGGIMREESYVYQMIITVLGDNKQVKGFSNLVSPGFVGKMLHGTLFESGKVKKKCKEFLKLDGNQISLYIPETLGAPCIGSCEPKIETYKKITGDKNWIGVLIWQHKENCDYSDETKCKGTIASGTTREIGEGKKYSAGAWSSSMRQGRSLIQKAPGGIFEIHNGGGASLPGKDCIGAIKSKQPIKDACTRSTITETAVKTKYLLDYISADELLNKYNCIYKNNEQLKKQRSASRGGRGTRKRRKKKRTKKKARHKPRNRRRTRKRGGCFGNCFRKKTRYTLEEINEMVRKAEEHDAHVEKYKKILNSKKIKTNVELMTFLEENNKMDDILYAANAFSQLNKPPPVRFGSRSPSPSPLFGKISPPMITGAPYTGAPKQ
uniref:Uncharacterized protein n=1 Tax=viral metagenome TaxID=1070528 RepID=A0A6C0C2K8_9ZZZZ